MTIEDARDHQFEIPLCNLNDGDTALYDEEDADSLFMKVNYLEVDLKEKPHKVLVFWFKGAVLGWIDADTMVTPITTKVVVK